MNRSPSSSVPGDASLPLAANRGVHQLDHGGMPGSRSHRGLAQGALHPEGLYVDLKAVQCRRPSCSQVIDKQSVRQHQHRVELSDLLQRMDRPAPLQMFSSCFWIQMDRLAKQIWQRSRHSQQASTPPYIDMHPPLRLDRTEHKSDPNLPLSLQLAKHKWGEEGQSITAEGDRREESAKTTTYPVQ